MQRLWRSRFVVTCAATAAIAAVPALARADTAVAITADNDLVTFDTATPAVVIRKVPVTGLAAGENLVGIDFRPLDGRLYALSSANRLYTIDRTSGAATAVAAPFTPTLSGADFGFDFNPAADRIRVVSDADQNLRLDPNTGTVVDGDALLPGIQPDANLSFALGDANVGANPNVVAAAYDQNAAGTATTTLFGIDANLDVLVRQGSVNGSPTSPNAGTLTTIGPLGVDTTGMAGLDVSGATTWASLTVGAATTSGLYTINPATGAATLVGTIAGGEIVRDIAIVPTRFLGLTVDNEIVTFGGASPGTVSPAVAITGLQGGEQILAVDVRPATGALYGLGSTGRLYRINTTTGAATQIGTGTFSVPLAGTDFGFDFNPVVDRIRVVSNTGQNFRIHPDTGQIVDADPAAAGTQLDTNLAFATGDPNAGTTPSVAGAAYDTNRAGAAATTLFVIDTNLDVLARQGSVGGTPSSPNGGQLTTIGPLGVNTGGNVAFDINGSGDTALAVLTAPGATTSSLYSINLATGTATLIGPVGGTKVLRSVTALSTTPTAAPSSLNMMALTTAGALVPFRSDTPGILGTPIPVTGLAGAEQLVAIDVRPSTGVLYGVTNQSRLYAINRTTGAATAIGTAPFEIALAGTEFGMDFNPAADRIRITSDTGQNLRIDPTTGTVVDADAATAGAQADANLAFVGGDPNAGATPSVTALAYDRNTQTAPAATTLFGIDTGHDVLVRVGSVDGAPNSPNAGQLTTIGPLGVDTTAVAGMEIGAGNAPFAALNTAGGPSRLYTLDLAGGSANLVGEFPAGTTVRGLSIAPTANLGETGSGGLTIQRLVIDISFCGSGKDTISMSGSLPAPTGTLAGTMVTVDVGGFSRTFTLDARGRDRSAGDSFQLLGRPKNGVQKFSVVLKKEDVSDELSDEGFTAEQDFVRVERQVPVTIDFGGTTFTSMATVVYSAKAEHRGNAKLKK